MIEKLEIENFRCFKTVKIQDLKRVNIIVGNNASGKSALLETIKVGLDGSPQALPWLNQLRNILTAFPSNPTPEQFQSLFIDFFHQFNNQEEILISITDSEQRTAKLRIYFDPSKAVTIQSPIGFQLPPLGFQQRSVPSPPPATMIPLAFERTDFQTEKNTIFATINPQGFVTLDPGKPMGIISGFIVSNNIGGPGESATWLSKLSIEKRSEEIIKAIRKHFPFISDITSETPIPGMGTLYADIKNLPRKIPLSLVSSGISRLFTVMLSIVEFGGGVVLIDEIENGIFHEEYSKMWDTLIDLAKRHETQLFISTHSLECVQNLLPSIEANEEEILLLRIDKENGSSRITPIQSKFIEAAIEQGFDVR
jgi:hypothetical protein